MQISEEETSRLMWCSLVGLDEGSAMENDSQMDEAIQNAFDLLDADKNGMVSRDELTRAILRGFGGNEADEAVQAMIASADTDGDDQIDFAEFKRMLLGSKK